MCGRASAPTIDEGDPDSICHLKRCHSSQAYNKQNQALRNSKKRECMAALHARHALDPPDIVEARRITELESARKYRERRPRTEAQKSRAHRMLQKRKAESAARLEHLAQERRQALLPLALPTSYSAEQRNMAIAHHVLKRMCAIEAYCKAAIADSRLQASEGGSEDGQAYAEDGRGTMSIAIGEHLYFTEYFELRLAVFFCDPTNAYTNKILLETIMSAIIKQKAGAMGDCTTVAGNNQALLLLENIVSLQQGESSKALDLIVQESLVSQDKSAIVICYNVACTWRGSFIWAARSAGNSSGYTEQSYLVSAKTRTYTVVLDACPDGFKPLPVRPWGATAPPRWQEALSCVWSYCQVPGAPSTQAQYSGTSHATLKRYPAWDSLTNAWHARCNCGEHDHPVNPLYANQMQLPLPTPPSQMAPLMPPPQSPSPSPPPSPVVVYDIDSRSSSPKEQPSLSDARPLSYTAPLPSASSPVALGIIGAPENRVYYAVRVGREGETFKDLDQAHIHFDALQRAGKQPEFVVASSLVRCIAWIRETLEAP
ncbi:hypothetical protein B0H17DRAFT_1132098 [Mycena rosella]|uniref:Uncharacterized protein n=1 Tax=Mycena rosella TaxID=1033263 RepID=A0AAD7GL28_MYCRO|nr:hypothetical protein B0H17DRAFT_1132098 [Mycena rosella]